MLNDLSAILQTYELERGDYPPSSLDELGGRAPNGVNNGIETLVAAVSSKKRKGGILYQPREGHYSNVDGDRASRNVTGWYFGNNELREVKDHFGYVLIYLHHRDYTRPGKSITTYQFGPAGDRTTVRAEKSASTRAYVGPGKFQLRSVGSDGVFGTDDDVIFGQ